MKSTRAIKFIIYVTIANNKDETAIDLSTGFSHCSAIYNIDTVPITTENSIVTAIAVVLFNDLD